MYLLSPMLREVDGSSIAFFRISFGALLLIEVYRYFANGWIDTYWIEPSFHFTYFGLDWVRPWPGIGVYATFFLLGVASFTLCLGMAYRASAVIVFLTFTYQFLLEQARYLNHFYAVCLLAFLLIFIPGNASFTLPSSIFNVRRSKPVRMWAVALVRFQVGVIYVFAGIAKLNPAWISGEAFAGWMESRANVPLVAFLQRQNLEVPVFGFGGLFVDLLIVPGLLWRRTRPAAFLLATLFHLANSQLFRIGIFPWLMIAATTVFFPPDWPRRVARVIFDSQIAQRSTASFPIARTSRAAVVALSLFVTVQMVFPLRHWLYPGDVAWTEEGHRFSWRMMLRGKQGTIRFTQVTQYDTAEVDHLRFIKPWQARIMVTHPDMILQLAHRIALEAPGSRVYASAMVSIHGRTPVPLIDSTVDLSSVPRSLRPATWILPARVKVRPQATGGSRHVPSAVSDREP